MKKLFLFLTILLTGTALYIGCGFTEGFDKDPNNPTSGISAKQFFTAIQVQTYVTLEGQLSRTAAVWTQQMAGTDRQYLALGRYQITENDWDGEFTSIYVNAGLNDIRNLQKIAQQYDNKVFLGIAQFYEALVVGTAASLWGDVPYSQAVQPTAFPTPILDKQSIIFANLQTLLDSAISNLNTKKTVNIGLGGGPAEIDFGFGGDPVKWGNVCHTLKARYYLLWAKKDPSNYSKALAEANLGISSITESLNSVHSGADGENSIWFQFTQVQRPGYCKMGKFLVDLMKTRKDTLRLKLYATGGTVANISGADAGEENQAVSDLGSLYGNPESPFPLVTYEENQLMKAECKYRTNDQPGALNDLNALRVALEQKYNFPPGTYPPLVLAGPALLAEILTEKYISLFLQVGVYNDWKRTDTPVLTPYGGKSIPRRLIYGLNERNTNPNIPSPSAAPPRNENDPN